MPSRVGSAGEGYERTERECRTRTTTSSPGPAVLALSPFRALQGIDEGAQAAHELAEVGQRVAAIAEQYPQQLRWQMELLLYETEDRETVEVLRTTASSLGESAERLAAVAETLPEDLDRVLAGGLEALSASGDNLRPTLAETRALTEALAQALGAVQGATAAVDETLILVRDWPREPEDPDAPPFDITQYTEAIDRATAALRETGTVLERLEGFATSPALTSSMDELDARTRALVDHAALRAVQVASFVILLAAASFVIARRLGRPDAGSR